MTRSVQLAALRLRGPPHVPRRSRPARWPRARATTPSETEAQTLTILSSFTTGNATGDHLNKIVEGLHRADRHRRSTSRRPTPTTSRTAYEASKLADEERDLVILNLTPSTSDWLPQGQVVDVKKYLDEWGITDKLVPEALQFWTQGDDGVAGFPYTGFNWPIWYNTDLLKQAGVTAVPTTVDELIAAAAKLRAAKIQPMVLGGAEWPVQNFITWMVQQYVKPDEAQQIFTKGGYCASPGAVQGLDLLGQAARLRRLHRQRRRATPPTR